MIPIRDLVTTAKQSYKSETDHWGYIWGKSGQTWTQASQNAATREMTVKYGQQWVGKRVADCYGLFVFAFRENGGKIYHGSDTIWNQYTVPETRTALAGEVKIRHGAAVFQVNEGGGETIGMHIYRDNGGAGDKYMGSSDWTLSPYSYGNNVQSMNAQ